MPTKQEIMAEAYKRGLLPPEKAAMYEEAMKRGLVKENVDFSTTEMVKNIPSSALKYGKDIYSAVSHPVDTAKAVGNVGMGYVDKAARNLTEALPQGLVSDVNQLNNWLADHGFPLRRVAEDPKQMKFPQEVYADMVNKAVMSRYGSMDRFKSTLMEDPVGVLADVASVMSAGGAIAQRVGGAGKISKYGTALRKAGAAADPVNLAMNAGKGAIKALTPKGTPARMYESAAKFGTTIPQADRSRMTKTALREGLMPTTNGVRKLDTIADMLNSDIDNLIADATKKGKTIPKGAVFMHLKKLRQKLGGPRIDAAEDLKKINKVAAKFNKQMEKLGKNSLTPEELQRFKQDAYKTINFKRKQQKASLADEGARKAMARAAKEKIEAVVPGVKDLNMRLGDLLELRPSLERSAGRIDNLNLASINAPLNIGAGGVAGGAPGATAGAVLAILEMPKIKAKGAIWLEKVKKMPLKAIMKSGDPDIALIRQALLQAGRTEEQASSPVAR